MRAIQGGSTAGFRLTSTSKRHAPPELIEWLFHGHYARQEPAGALFMEHSTNARASIVAALYSFLATAYSVSVCSLLEFHLYSCRRSPGLKRNFPSSFSPGCFWFGSLLFAIKNTPVSLLPETWIRPPDQRVMLVPWRHAGCVKPHNGETKYWRPQRSRAGPSVHPHFWHS